MTRSSFPSRLHLVGISVCDASCVACIHSRDALCALRMEVEVKTSFIVFEGVDGAGTTTQSRMLADRLRQHQRPTNLTREPSDGPIGVLLRQMLSRRVVLPDGRSTTRQTLALMFAADRLDHIAAEIDPALEQGTTVISDRYYHSSLAYQGDPVRQDDGTQAVDYSWIHQLNSRARVPDLTFFLRVDVETSLARLSTRAQRDIYETREEIERLVLRYDEVISLMRAEGQRIVSLDGTKPILELHEEIWSLVSHWFDTVKD